jgi:hypothetical protein
MINYVGNCKHIDWDRVIADCAAHEPEYIGPSHKRGDTIPGLDPILDMWNNAGYKTVAEGGTVAWDMFMPGKQFDQAVIDQFCEFFEIPDYHTAWISRIHQGRFAPQHWDVNDEEEKLALLPPKVRYHAHIGKPKFGHVFIVEDKCFYNQEQGATYRWDDRKYWHAGTNCGLEPKYILNLW